MKRNELMALIATTILMFAVCMSASAKGKRNVERGMTKQEVIAILGEPKLTSFDMYGDKWEYAKYNNLFGDSKYITVFFDRSEKVVEYNTRIIGTNSQQPNGQQPQQPQQPSLPPYDGGYYPNGGMNSDYCLDDASFSKLYNKIKKTNFDDNKFDLIEVASLGCYYSCAQVVRIMKIFSFDDSKIKVLSMMAPRIVICRIQQISIAYSPLIATRKKQQISYEIADNPCKTMDNDNITSNKIISKFLFLLHYTLNR